MRDSEFWIYSDGFIQSANADIDDISHEGIALEAIRSIIVNKAEQLYEIVDRNGRLFTNDDYINWDEFVTALGKIIGKKLIKRNIKNGSLEEVERLKKILYDNPDDFFYEFASEFLKIDKETINCACENYNIDPREYAIKRWKWKSYRYGYIESYRLAKSDLNAILDGLYNISENLGWSDRILKRKIFNIYSYESKKRYSFRYDQILNLYNRPSAIKNQDNEIEINQLSNQATKQLRNIEIDNLHPFYRMNRGGSWNGGGVINQLGDSILSFKDYLKG